MTNEIKEFLLENNFIARTSGMENYFEKKIDNDYSIIAIVSESNKNWINIHFGIFWKKISEHYKKIYKSDFKEHNYFVGKQMQCILLTSAENIRVNLKNIIGPRIEPVDDKEIKTIQIELYEIINDFECHIENGCEKIIEESIKHIGGNVTSFEMIPVAIFMTLGAQSYHTSKAKFRNMITNNDYIKRFDIHTKNIEKYFKIPPI